VLPRSAVLADHRRAAEVQFTLRAGPAPSALGLPGTTLNDGPALPLGGGTHGGLTAAEMSIVMILAGPRARRGALSEWPAGLADIAPTALSLLGVAGGETMDGRVLAEAFAAPGIPQSAPVPESWETPDGAYRQRLARMRFGRQTYIDFGERL
jgi:arylsulfatase A-like enzyme